MRYLGGKSRYGAEIASLIPKGRPVYEPFCGALWVTQHLQPLVASDVNHNLIDLYRAVRNGWEPPDEVDEDEYLYLSRRANAGEESPRITFVGYACSFSGKWFNGYARGSGRNFCLESKKALLTKLANCVGTQFRCLNYLNVDVSNIVIYCDPPYADTTEFAGRDWCSQTFWKWVRGRIAAKCEVFISEYEAPADFVPIKRFDHFNLAKARTVEKIFKHQSQVSFLDDLMSL